VVIGRWAADTALVRTDDGRALEVPVPERLRDRFDVGAEVLLDPTADRMVAVEPVRAR
jgi:hypothetical protein